MTPTRPAPAPSSPPAPATEAPGHPHRTPALLSARIEASLPLYRPLVERALTGEASPREAIKAFCLSCVGETRADVTGCTSYTCPLWLYRPYQP